MFLRPFHQTLRRHNSNKTKFTILNSVLAKLVSHFTPFCSHCLLWIKPGHNYPIPYLLAAWPCQAEPHLADQLGRRRSTPPPPLSPCLGDIQHLTAAHYPLPEPGPAMDHREIPAPSATAPCRARARAPHPARVHMPPLDRIPRPPRRHHPGSTPDTPSHLPTPHSHRSPSKPPPLPHRASCVPDQAAPPHAPKPCR